MMLYKLQKIKDLRRAGPFLHNELCAREYESLHAHYTGTWEKPRFDSVAQFP